MARNLTVELLAEMGETIDEYDGLCGELADILISKLGEDVVSILYIDGKECDLRCGDHSWSYHMVPIVHGVVHDAWFPDLMLPPRQYLKAAFPKQRMRFSVVDSDGAVDGHL